MTYGVSFTDEAEYDLDCIEEYLSQFYPSTARNFFDKFKKSTELLSDMPLMYPEYEEDSFFRKMSISDYLFYYHVDEERKQIIFHRIFHMKRDISHQILSYKKHTLP